MLGSVGEPDGRPGGRARRAFLVLLVGGLVTIAHAAAAGEPDTLWYGGVDPVTGLAVEGGVWDFEDCTPQGWTSRDLTAIGPFFHHVTAETTAAHGDPMATVITANGSMGSIWCGVHEDDARAACWPGGMGYSNYWRQSFKKSFVYSGSGDVTLEIDYFTDSERQLDVTYIYVSHGSEGKLGPLNMSGAAMGYSGSAHEGNAIGSPEAPAHDTIVIGEALLPGPGEPFEVMFEVVSDAILSDGLDSAPSFLDTRGFFGIDNISVSGGALDDISEFEPSTGGDEYGGWSASSDSIGVLMRVAELAEVDPPTDPCDVSGCVLVSSDADGPEPHPYAMLERLRSNVVPVPAETGGVWLQYDANLGFSGFFTHLYYSVNVAYYPWTCSETGVVGWTPEPEWLQDIDGLVGDACRQMRHDLSPLVPVHAESLRVVLDIGRSCPPGVECFPDASTGDAPYWDNIRVGVVAATVGIPDSDSDPAPKVDLRIPTPMGAPGVIDYSSPARGAILIHDVAGRLVSRTEIPPAMNGDRVSWRHVAPGAPPGVYFVTVEAHGWRETKRVVFVP